jgi:tetratricopeptide (TPR) repeat protein
MALLIRSDYRLRRSVLSLLAAAWLAACLPYSLRADDSSFDPNAQYRIGDETRLVEIAVRLYGDADMFAEIAEWNGMSEPFRLRKGQVLVLKKPPTLDSKEGDQAVLAYWRKHFDNQGETIPAAQTKIAETGNLSREMVKARDSFAEGQKLFDGKKLKKALAKFKESRKIDPDFLPAWFYEIRTLKLLKKEKAAKAASDELLKRRPELQALPMFKGVTEESEPAAE